MEMVSGSGHVAVEDDVAGGDAFELAGELVAVGEDQDIGWRSRAWRELARGLSKGERDSGEKGEE